MVGQILQGEFASLTVREKEQDKSITNNKMVVILLCFPDFLSTDCVYTLKAGHKQQSHSWSCNQKCRLIQSGENQTDGVEGRTPTPLMTDPSLTI